MKKKVLSLLLVISMIAMMLMGCGGSEEAAEEEEAAGGPKVGITIQSLKNDYWAGVMGKLEEVMTEAGYEYTLIDCEDNAATQVSQIENFITDGCDFIMVHPSDAAAVEGICGEALAAGIKVMCWDDPMENTTANWVLDNTALGAEIGKTAAEFINEHYTADAPAKVVTIGYPSTKVLLERENGIKAGLEEACNPGVYEIVASVEGIEANDALTNCETALSANPDATVFVGVGAGAMIGANEALLQTYGGAGNIPENVGVITTDVTMQQLESLKAGDEAVRAIVGFEGSNMDTAKACFEMFERIIGGEEFEGDARNVFRGTQPITADNIDEIMAGM
jgi:ribose transport system substrate-binding protein